MARVWDHFLVNGWKTVFKATLLVLKTYEEEILGQSFEEILAGLPNLFYRFFVDDCEKLAKMYPDLEDGEEEQNEDFSIRKVGNEFDR